MDLGSWRRRARAWLERHPKADMAWETVREFLDDDAPIFAGALAFFGVFAVVPVVVLTLWASLWLWGGDDGTRQVLAEMVTTAFGDAKASALSDVIRNVKVPAGGWVAAAVAALVLALAASRLFAYLARSLNRIWDVRPKAGRGFLRVARKRALAFVLVLVVSVVLLLSLVATAVFSGLDDAAARVVPFDPWAFAVLRFVAGLLLLVPLFALVYRYVPDAVVEWRDAFVGGTVTALLVLAGQVAIGRAVAGSAVVGAYGGLASLAVLLLWFYYTSLVFIFGAEFTQVYARRHGVPLEPKRDLAEREGRKGGAPGAARPSD